MFLEAMLREYPGGPGPKCIFSAGRWQGQRRVDTRKQRFLELTQPAWCRKEKIGVSPVELACYAWQQREQKQYRKNSYSANRRHSSSEAISER